MMSTTGRRPVIAAPTPMPVNPASEIGVSNDALGAEFFDQSGENFERRARFGDVFAENAHARVASHFFGQRFSHRLRKCQFDASGIDVLHPLGRQLGYGAATANFTAASISARASAVMRSSAAASAWPSAISHFACSLIGIALGLPMLFFLLGAVILAIDVADVMAAVAVCIAWRNAGPSPARARLHQARRNVIDRAHILTVDSRCLNPECGGAAQNRSRRCFGVVRVLVVEIVFANVDHRQLPELRQIHHFIERSLPQRTFAEETHRNPAICQTLRGKRRAGRDPHAAADDCICAQIAGRGIGNVHRSALAAAIARPLCQAVRRTCGRAKRLLPDNVRGRGECW